VNLNDQAQGKKGSWAALRLSGASVMRWGAAVLLLTLVSTGAPAMTGPTTTITSLTDEQIIQQQDSIVVNVTASSPDGPIQKVEFFVDQVKRGEDTTAPYSFTVPPLPPGRHAIGARAWDPTSSRGDGVWVYVNQTPWGDMTAPENGSIVQSPASILLKADAVGTEGVTKVEFRSNGNVIGTVTAKPYEFNWTNAPAGFHTVDALVYDKLGGVAPTKDTLSITVIGPPPAAATVSGGVSRKYTYNAHQDLCRTVEPETGATLMGYDAAGNLAWSAGGLPASTACDAEGDTAAILARRITRTYDARNRLKTLTFPDGRGNQAWTYTADNLPASIVTDNGGDQIITNSYSYNRLRLLAGERLTWGAIDWPIAYNYNSYGHLSSQTYPDGTSVAFNPNALGQPRQVGTYASDISYYPNGAVASFTYGNSIKHTLTQNLRQMPLRSLDEYGTSKFVDDTYSYDQVGNVAAIGDGLPDNRGDRVMTYDTLNRLTKVKSTVFGTGIDLTAQYGYDKVDNLTSITIAGPKGRKQAYCYDANNRLTNVKTGDCSTGSTVIGLGYDVQGNLANKNGQVFNFDFGNRLRGVNGTSYLYDGYGRRVRDSTVGSKYSFYSNDGQLVYTSDARTGKATNYFYLGSSLVATQEKVSATGATTVLYQHTDGLGSPIAVTNQSRTVVERSEYEPYGQQIFNRTATDGPGYTGHVYDSAIGLNYMQQRYYDPLLGRFVSVDPISADSVGGGNFNRYWYANNNPYGNIDPDGRQACGTNTTCRLNQGERGGVIAISTPAPNVDSSMVPKAGASAAPTAQGGWYEDNIAGRNWFTGPGSFTDYEALAHDLTPLMFYTPAGRVGSVGVGVGEAALNGPSLARMLAVTRLGKLGEIAVRSVYNIGGKRLIAINGRFRIPDGINTVEKTISEIKNVASQSYTTQLRDYVAYAKSKGYQFVLYVRPGARLSGPLRQAETAGDVVIRNIP